MFEVTKFWIKAYQSGNGGWNKKQLAAIGVDWPPQSGWIDSVTGKLITEEKKREFEDLQGLSIHKVNIKRHIDSGAHEAIYQTTPDGKGGWTGKWLSELRWPFSRDFRKDQRKPQ